MEDKTMNEQCEFPGHHYGEVLRVRPDERRLFQKDKWICQGHLYYVCWDYTIFIHVDALKRFSGIPLNLPDCVIAFGIHVDALERERNGILGEILKPCEEWMKEKIKTLNTCFQ